MRKTIHISVGDKFGRLTVTKVLESDAMHRERRIEAKCDCGSTHIASVHAVNRGTTVSCGCFQREQRIKHGKSRSSSVYRAWVSMTYRCSSPSCKHWPDYGGRGIKVCDRWKDFKNFFADMGERPASHSIERMNNNGNYEPGNCRWATALEQNRNRRSTKNITHQGKTQCMDAWAAEIGIHRATLKGRLYRGWSVADALSKPPSKCGLNRHRHDRPH